jgi:hypothetical protein
MLRRRWILVAVIALVAVTATTAHAAKLGGTAGFTSKKLFALSAGGQDALPFTLVRDSFTSASNAVLDLRATEGPGPVWHEVRGTLAIRNSALRSLGLNGAPYAAGVVEGFRSSATVTVGIRGETNGGVLLNSDATARNAIGARWTGTDLQIVRLTNGLTSSPLSSVTVTGVSTSTFTTMTATSAGGTYTVSLPGATTLTYTLPAADQSTFAGRTLMGVAFWAPGGTNLLDDFLVTK